MSEELRPDLWSWTPDGPIPDDWLPEGTSRADYQVWLESLLELPAELVLPTHGDPGTRERLEQALRTRRRG